MNKRFASLAEMKMLRMAARKEIAPTTPVERDLEILEILAGTSGEHGDGWCRPLDVGGHDGSDHSYRLTRLVHSGLAEQRQRGSLSSGRRGSKHYRINDAGKARLAGRRQRRCAAGKEHAVV